MTTDEIEWTPALIAAAVAQLGLLMAGIVTLWRVRLSPTARIKWQEPPVLPPWNIGLAEFGFALMVVLVGGVAGQIVATQIVGHWELPPDTKMVLVGAGFQLGLLGGIGAAMFPRKQARPSLPAGPPVVVLGAVTLLAAFPVLQFGNLGWVLLLEKLGIDTARQPLVDIFANAESPLLVGVMGILAVVIAPLAEELIFRAGLFRYLRSRVPRSVALILPALIFGSLHGNWVAFVPLFLLAIVLSLAYERTGRIAVPIIAHALFNLNTMLLLLAGVDA